MSRPLRIAYQGACYHIMNRGLAHKPIFVDDSHRQIFLDLLFEIHNRYQAEIYAYCLMDNHYHLLLRTPLGNIGRIMRHLDGVYTQRFNRSVKRDGPLFRGRYKSILVEADVYLLRLSRYIHLNPVEAKLIKKAEQFRWSSYQAYLSGTSSGVSRACRRLRMQIEFYLAKRLIFWQLYGSCLDELATSVYHSIKSA